VKESKKLVEKSDFCIKKRSCWIWRYATWVEQLCSSLEIESMYIPVVDTERIPWRRIDFEETYKLRRDDVWGGGLRLKSKNSISLSGKLLVNINLLHSPTSWIYRWRNKCDEMRSNSLRSMYRTFLWINETYLLTPECRVLLEQLTGLQTVKKFPVFHGTRRFITALTSVRHLSLSWASPIQSIYQHPTS